MSVSLLTLAKSGQKFVNRPESWWEPSEFHAGPNPGPPPGEAYSTVGYGLFERFELRQVR